MKKLLLLAIVLFGCLNGYSQATDLVVDNQNPGWLSSLIPFGDQKTVNNLKVTGYINDTDLKFIGTLMNNRNLCGRLDLSDVNVVDIEGKDNYLPGGMFALERNDTISFLSLPKTCTDFYNCLDVFVDTLLFDCNIHFVKNDFLGTMPYHMIIGANVDTIPDYAFYGKSPISIKLSNSTKYIGDRAFAVSNLEKLNFNDLVNLDYLGDFAFVAFDTKQNPYSSYCPDTIIVPDELKTFNSGAFMFKEGQHFFFGESIESITASVGQPYSTSKYGLCSSYAAKNRIILHMKTVTPPSLYTSLSSKHTVYVPKGAAQNYLNSSFGSATIIEEEPFDEKVVIIIKQGNNGSVSMSVDKGSTQSFTIQPENGWKIHSVTFNDADVTGELDASNCYTTPTITDNSTLYVTFEEDAATEAKATEASDIHVQGTSFGVRILNAANETVNIYMPDGVLVKTVKVAGTQMDVELPEGGIYLVKVAAKTVKVSR